MVRLGPVVSSVGLLVSDLTRVCVGAVSFSQCDIPRSAEDCRFVRLVPDVSPKLIELFNIVVKCAALVACSF